MTEEKIKDIAFTMSLPVDVVRRLADFGWTETDFYISTGREMFHDLLEHEGISGYSGLILGWINRLLEADLLYFD